MDTWKNAPRWLVSLGWLLLVGTLACGAPNRSAEDLAPRIVVQGSGVSASLRGVAVENDRTAWISGTEGTLLKTTDAGSRWETVRIAGAEELDFRDIEILGAGTALVMSVGSGELSRVYRTSDGGVSWDLVLKNTEDKAFFNGFAFWDAQRGVLTSDSFDGRPYLLVTQDGGGSWSRLAASVLPELREGEYGFAASGTGLAAVGESHLWVATGGAAARVFFSPDAGKSWEVFATPIGSGTPSSGIFSLAFRGQRSGIAVGGDYENPSLDRGNAAWTEDGGRTWTLATAEGGMPQKACVRFLGGDRYLAAGRTGLAYSSDGGRRWFHISDSAFYAIDYDPRLGAGWVVGPEGAVARLQTEPSVP